MKPDGEHLEVSKVGIAEAMYPSNGINCLLFVSPSFQGATFNLHFSFLPSL